MKCTLAAFGVSLALLSAGCSKIVGLGLETAYEKRDLVTRVVSSKAREFSFREIALPANCPPTQGFKGYCTHFEAEEVQEQWNNPFTVRVESSASKGVVSITMSRMNVEEYSKDQQAFALAVWNALLAEGVVPRVVREQETLSVPNT